MWVNGGVAGITPNSFTITWTLLTTSDADTGRDPITGQELEFLEVTSPPTTNWLSLASLSASATSFTVTSGYKDWTKYQVRVASVNGVGVGQFSDPFEL